MLFSIVIPVYNVEAYLPECLESVQAQSFRDYEVVLVNDGSTDRSLEICNRFKASQSCNVRVVSQENRGLLMARRAGFALASGEYIISLDSDDRLRPDALAVIADLIERSSSDIVCYDCSRDADFGRRYRSPLFREELVLHAGKRELIRSFCTTNSFNFMWSKAIKRSCLCVERDYSIFAGLNTLEDQLQLLDVLDSIETASYIAENLYYYRPNPVSLLHKHYVGRYHECERVRREELKYASRWSVEYDMPDLPGAVLMGFLQEVSGLSTLATRNGSYAEACFGFEEINGCSLFKEALERGDLTGLRADHRVMCRLIYARHYALAFVLAKAKTSMLAIGGQ